MPVDTLLPLLLDPSWDRILPGMSNISALYFSKRFLRKSDWSFFQMEQKMVWGAVVNFRFPNLKYDFLDNMHQFHPESANKFPAESLVTFSLSFSLPWEVTLHFFLMHLSAGIGQEAVVQGNMKQSLLQKRETSAYWIWVKEVNKCL